jgi:hypothetical protein
MQPPLRCNLAQLYAAHPKKIEVALNCEITGKEPAPLIDVIVLFAKRPTTLPPAYQFLVSDHHFSFQGLLPRGLTTKSDLRGEIRQFYEALMVKYLRVAKRQWYFASAANQIGPEQSVVACCRLRQVLGAFVSAKTPTLPPPCGKNMHLEEAHGCHDKSLFNPVICFKSIRLYFAMLSARPGDLSCKWE